MTAPTAAPLLWGLMAEFEGPTEAVEAARRVQEAGYEKVDAYSPYPIEELAEALGHHHSWLPPLVLLGGITGCIARYALQFWSAPLPYPPTIRAPPVHRWPPFI